ncbi:MAG: hypothetical protein ACR2MG_20355 [Pyrinomonadaceae bacterium]
MSYLDDKNLSPEQRATYKTLAILENSAAHQRLKQVEAEAFAEQQQKDAENQKLSEQHRLQREAELRIEAENFRKQSAANFETDLKRKFFEGNPFASESDFQKILPKLRENAMLANVDSSDKTEKLIRESGSYSRM